MDKKEEVEKLAQEIADICPDMVEDGCENKCYCCLAHFLTQRGYGNIELALTKFIEKLEENIAKNIVLEGASFMEKVDSIGNIIRETLKELLKQ